MLACDAHRFHEDARGRQRLHRLRCARRTSPCCAPAAAARARRPPHRHRLRPGAGARAARAAPTPRVFYRIFNADGDEVEQCGNGARCIAALLHRRGLTRDGAVTLDSPAGLVARARRRRRARVGGHGRAELRSALAALRCAAARPTAIRSRSPGADVEIGAVSIGNPHAVLTVAVGRGRPGGDRSGRAIERHPRFPKRVNVGFLEIVARDAGAPARLRARRRRDAQLRHRRVRGGRRGAAARPARARRCGWACAAASCSVNWAGPGEPIWLTGPTEISFEGHVEV